MAGARASIVRQRRRIEIELSAEELATTTGLSRLTLARLHRVGLVESTTAGGETFTADSAARLRRMLRLRADLRVNLVGAAIIVDLVDRLDRLQRELTSLRRRLPRA